MRDRTEKPQSEGQAIDLTPMLDVVFIMLIFFIVTASFIKIPGIDVMRTEASTAEKKSKVSILVAVSANDEIWIDKKQVDPSDLKLNVIRLHAENPKGGMVIQADSQSSIEMVGLVADVGKEIGISDIAVSAEEK